MQARHLVIGAGLAGASAAWRLAQLGEEVVVVEAFAPANSRGSSHGSARIFRHAYADPVYARLTVRALAGWHELERASGEQILTITGGIDFGPRRDLAGIEAVLSSLGLEHQRVPRAAASERWPHLRFDSDALHHPDAGVVDAEAAVRAMLGQAEALGARVLTDWRVTAVDETPRGVTVISATGERIECETLTVAAGPWLQELLPLLPADVGRRVPPLRVDQQQVVHFPFPDSVNRATDWPIFIHEADVTVYALPGGRDAADRGFKIAQHAGGTPTTASTRDGVVDPRARQLLVDYVRRNLPEVDPAPYAETTCLYTLTPREDFLIDRVGRVVIASPCSGHGAKFGPVLGELIADVAMSRSAVPEPFRFAAHAP